MIQEILKLNGSVLTRTFLFQTHKNSVFEKHNEQGTRRDVDTLRRCKGSRRRDVVRVQNPLLPLRCDVETSRCWKVVTSKRCDVGSV